MAWFERSGLRFSRTWFGVWLGEAYLIHGEREKARAILDEILATSREVGYRHLEGMASRVLGELLLPQDAAAASCHLESAARILDEVGARNEFAKTLVCQAELRRRVGNVGEARKLLERALAIFEELGTLDEPPRVRAVLDALTADTKA